MRNITQRTKTYFSVHRMQNFANKSVNKKADWVMNYNVSIYECVCYSLSPALKDFS